MLKELEEVKKKKELEESMILIIDLDNVLSIRNIKKEIEIKKE